MNIYIGGPVVISDMQGPAPDGFHVPKKSELQTVYNIGINNSLWTSSNGDGMKTYLKLPYAGIRDTTTTQYSGGSGRYWACDGTNTSTLGVLGIQSNFCGMTSANSISCFSIRPFKDSPVTPDSTWTELYTGLVYHSSTLGLISIKNGSGWITISDKNCGATTVYNSGDTLSESNCGKFYQRGNCYGFNRGGTTTTSSSQINASTYGPGNYYSDSTYRTKNPRDVSNNLNLRGGVTGAKPGEVSNIYIGEKPYDGDELCFTANTANSTVQLTKEGSPTSVILETSRDGKTWSTYTIGSTITLSNIGDKVFFRNTSTTTTAFSIDFENRYSFTMTGSIAGSGDVTTLVNKSGTDTLVGTECFRRLFYNCTSLTSSPELPAKSLTNSCYMQMFSLCTSLTTVPKLPATTLADMCYNSMFLGCTALTSAPELPASTMAKQCYYMMFRGCTALTTPPKLSSTALASSCYREMFNGCTSLETLPKLPATTLAAYCYRFMFNNCSKIKLSTTQTGAYQTAYRIPTTGTGTDGGSACDNMFTSTGGAFTGTPSINTTYYTSNTVV